MAKAIEQTPLLEGRDAVRFLDALSSVKSTVLSAHEKEVREIVRTLPKKLKL